MELGVSGCRKLEARSEIKDVGVLSLLKGETKGLEVVSGNFLKSIES